MQDRFLGKIYILHWSLFAVLTVIFSLCCFFYQPTFVLGYVIGACGAYLCFEIRQAFLTNIFVNKRSAVLNALANWVLSIALVGVLVASILVINHYFGGQHSMALFPINVFTFSLGLSNIMVAVILTMFFNIPKKRKGGPCKR
ncbi:hypothetical protein KQ874_00315 [Mycoplasma sp. ES3157-GEN-MYC]|uniref:Uncharacterized protein n=1 Tax=Mycoplasma miroungigenitalium TaxID=754515 RepID=A0A6M4JAH1_9MOLU|nr:hypothetical protein [Mycoplasma miroungigenitalium]MBU4690150.1 hypothetical protein [Mycoplasma miroungigenitalium]MBU4691423.1 hypothetical protein [Mycoplasma miroungigenitalium]QJR43258.1 hypothetical protein HLA87_00325 [Mycoplasma miroungigenitalium]